MVTETARSTQPGATLAQAAPYTPQYLLAALGAGGLSVSFFMYLMWMTPHDGAPIAHFASWTSAFAEGGFAMRALIGVAIAGVAIFALWHIRLMVWNLRTLAAWQRTSAYTAFRQGNMESQLMAAPLALAMSVNVGFIVGALFVPGLWGIREMLFPFALAAFAGIGVYALRIYLAFFARVLVDGGYDCAKSNNLGQMIAVFAFAMIGVGFSASAAMSAVPATVAIGFIGAAFFLAAAVILGAIKLVLGFRAMMEFRAGAETTPTLWIIIPLITVIGIGIYRLKMSLAHQFGVPVTDGEIFALLSVFLGIQLLFGLIGWAVMRRVGYFGRWVNGPEKSPGAFALVCPRGRPVCIREFLHQSGPCRHRSGGAALTGLWPALPAADRHPDRHDLAVREAPRQAALGPRRRDADPLARSRCADAHGLTGDACRNRSAGKAIRGKRKKRGAIPAFCVGRARRRRQPPCHSRG